MDYDQLDENEQLWIDVICANWDDGACAEPGALAKLLERANSTRRRQSLLLELLKTQCDAMWSSAACEAAGAPQEASRDFWEFVGREGPEVFDWPESLLLSLVAYDFSLSQAADIRPTISEYLTRFPHLRGMKERLQAELFHEWPLTLWIAANGQQYVGPLRTNLQIGRQCDDDLPPVALLRDAPGLCRLVITAARDRLVSRNHLLLEYIARSTVRAVNVSSCAPVVLPSEQVLKPGASLVVSCPVTLQLGNTAIHVTADD